MRGPAVRPIVIAAGGTGGHFFPAEALAAELIRRGRRVVLMTDARSATAVANGTFAGREQFILRGAGIAGRSVRRAAPAIVALAVGICQARVRLARLDAAVVVAFGGYPSIAPVLGARLLRHGPPVILHEQNAVLGRANRCLARHAALLALSFPGTARVPARVRAEVVGNPVRPAFVALTDGGYAPPGGIIRLLVLGGSLGARLFSDIMPAALAALPEAMRRHLLVTQQCRIEDLQRVRAAYAASGIAAELSAFFPDIADRFTAAHLVIARAGASTVAELATVGRPAILVPLPSAIDDHQTANANALVAARGASLLAQRDATPDALRDRIAALLAEPDMLIHAAAAARRLARPDAAVRLADRVEQLMLEETR
jgi:UDP-N-acetylglucosamine--N-acetylmuramyl-(pentapeptide) pyrophosphoryl-undecaprenol N-acetylglucosamine transferase